MKTAILFLFMLLFALVSGANFFDTTLANFNEGSYFQTVSTADGNIILDNSGDYYSSGDYNSQIFNSNYSNNPWNSLLWNEGGHYGEELGDNNCSVQQVDGNMCGNVLLMHLNENVSGAGQTINDTSGESNNGLTYGDTDCTGSGKLGKSCYFDGVGDYIQVPYDSSLDGMSGLTVAVWANVAECEQTDEFVKKDLAYILRMNASCTVDIHTWASTHKQLESSKTFSTNEWVHLALVYNPNLERQEIYINGALDSFTSQTGNIDVDAGQPLTIGAHQDGASEFMKGSIDEVAIWNRALTAQELLSIYKRGVLRIKFQARGCSDSTCSQDPSFIGGDGTTDSYFIDGNVSHDLNYFDGNQFLQYKATLETDDTNILKGTTPHLLDVNISYSVIDSTNPNVVADYNNGWQSTDANIILTCTDNNSGCANVYYRLDSNSGSDVTYGSWQIFDENILVNVDGNYALDFNAVDNAGNWVDTNTIYILVDSTAPIIAVAPDYNYSVTDTNFSTTDSNYDVTFLATDSVSDINTYFVSLDNISFTSQADNNYTIYGSVGDINNLYVKAKDNADNNSATLHLIISFTMDDADSDGIADSNDTLYGNKNDVNFSGTDDLNATIGNLDANGSFIGVQTVRFYNGSTLFLEFDHNFSASDLNMSKFSVLEFAPNSIIVKNDNDMDTNKTIYITDNSFSAICVKDSNITSVSEISSACNQSDQNEFDFSSCLGGTATISGIVCTDSGSIIKIENLRHSGIRGTVASIIETPVPTGAGVTIYGGVPRKQKIYIDKNNPIIYTKEFFPQLKEGLPIIEKIKGLESSIIKRLATEKEIKITRSIRIFSLLKTSGEKSGYFNEITISIKNLSEETLYGLELIESIPKGIVSKASMISSDNNFTIIEEDPIIRFNFPKIEVDQTIEFKYDFNRDLSDGEITQEDFATIKQPVVLIEMETNDTCSGLICNDYDDCTSDGCYEGKCVFEDNGSCDEKKATTGDNSINPNFVLSLLIILAIIIIITIYFFKKEKMK